MSIVSYNREKWGKGYAFFTLDGVEGVPVLVSAEDDKTGDIAVVSPFVIINDSRMFSVAPQYLIPVTADEYCALARWTPGEERAAPVDLEDYDLRLLSDVRP